MPQTLPATGESMHDDAARLVRLLDAAPPGPAGVVRIDVVADHGTESWTLRFARDSVSEAPGSEADAVLRLGADDVVRLAAGEADGALLYLSGRLEVAGDEQLVLALGSALNVPGADRALIDPLALDPVAVSVAIADVSSEHLSAVMDGGFRDLVLTEVFRRLPGFLDAEKAARVRVTIMFEVERVDADPDRYVVRVDQGACTVQPHAPADVEVDATLVLAGHEFLRLVLGHLNPVRGVLSGQIRVRGQVLKALGFNSVMTIPGS